MPDEIPEGLRSLINVLRGTSELRGVIRQTVLPPLAFRLGNALRIAGTLATEGISYTPDLLSSDIQEALAIVRATQAPEGLPDNYPDIGKFVKPSVGLNFNFVYTGELTLVHKETGERFGVPMSLGSSNLMTVNEIKEQLAERFGSFRYSDEYKAAFRGYPEGVLSGNVPEEIDLADFDLEDVSLLYVKYSEDVADLVEGLGG